MVSVIIPTFNGLELLKICLPSLRKQTFKNFEVILVDNGSDDGSIEFVQNNFPKFKTLKLNKNYGFAKAVNIGIKKSNSKYILLLNNDTEADKNCLYYLVQSAIKHPEVGFVSAKSFNFYKRNIIDNAGDDIDVSGHLFSRGRGEKDRQEFRKSGYIFLGSGNGTLFKREVFDSIGLFDEDFFFYMEDADLSLRAQLFGFKGWFEPRAKIYHMRMVTASKKLPLAEYLVFRNMMVTITKNFPLKLFIKNFNFLKIILVNFNTIRYFLTKGMVWEALRAEFYILFNLGKILEKRKKIQSAKRVSDEYIIENILDKKIKVGKLSALKFP